MTSRAHYLRGLVRAVGARTALNIVGRRKFGVRRPVRVRVAGHSLVLRPWDSDAFVAAQIFGFREYDVGRLRQNCLNELATAWREQGGTPLIIDAGANVGYSSVFLAESYPAATVLAVEPDDRAFSLLEENCAGCDRIIPIHAALWSHDQGVSLHNVEAASWARSITDHGMTPSCTLATLLNEVHGAKPLILKLDVEGAEREICGAALDVIRSFPCILIEPHDYLLPGTGSLAPLFSAIAGKDMDVLVERENIMLFDNAYMDLPASKCGQPDMAGCEDGGSQAEYSGSRV